MTKRKTILICIALIALATLVLVNAEVYSTPGFESISSDVSLSTNLQENLTIAQEEDSTDNAFPFWLIFVGIITLAAIFIQGRFLLKKRKKKRKSTGLVPNLVEDALKNMDKAKDISKTSEEFDELINEFGLDEVKDKIIKVDKDE